MTGHPRKITHRDYITQQTQLVEEISQMKRLYCLSVMLLAVLMIGLTACGGGGAERVSSDSGAVGSQPAADSAQASKGDPAAGQEKFISTCSACHGPEGKGIEGLGKDMTTSQFIAGKSDQALIDFIKVGRDPSDPLNTTGVGMPPKGGNPALSEDDLHDIVAYIRTIHK